MAWSACIGCRRRRRTRADGRRARGWPVRRHRDYVLLIEATRAGDLHEIRRDAASAAALQQLGFTEQGFAIYNLLYEVSPLGSGTALGDRR